MINALQKSGQGPAAVACLTRAVEAGTVDSTKWYEVMNARAEEGTSEGSHADCPLMEDDRFESLRTDPRFVISVARMGFEQLS